MPTLDSGCSLIPGYVLWFQTGVYWTRVFGLAVLGWEKQTKLTDFGVATVLAIAKKHTLLRFPSRNISLNFCFTGVGKRT